MSSPNCGRPFGSRSTAAGSATRLGAMARFERDVLAYGPTSSYGNSAPMMSSGAGGPKATSIGSLRASALKGIGADVILMDCNMRGWCSPRRNIGHASDLASTARACRPISTLAPAPRDRGRAAGRRSGGQDGLHNSARRL